MLVSIDCALCRSRPSYTYIPRAILMPAITQFSASHAHVASVTRVKVLIEEQLRPSPTPSKLSR